MKRNLGLLVLSNASTLGSKVNEHLKKINNKDYLIDIKETRFANGEGKVRINESVRDKDLYVLADIGNYGETYEFRGSRHIIAPDEHFSDVKRVISAVSGHASRINLIMPLLYESRQDKKDGRESLDCAIGLQEIKNLGVDNFITFDAHNPAIINAIPTMCFENFYPTSEILETLIETDSIKLSDDTLILAPDFGAMQRARYYAEMLGTDVGAFYKRRDYSKIVNGKNPIVEHAYLGKSMKDKNVIIVDDMIASGGSVLEVSEYAKKCGARKVFICATFALFTEGIERIEEAYKNGKFDCIFSTNLSYVPEEIKKKRWYVDVDCSDMIARIINAFSNGESLEPIHHENLETYKRLRRKK